MPGPFGRPSGGRLLLRSGRHYRGPGGRPDSGPLFRIHRLSVPRKNATLARAAPQPSPISNTRMRGTSRLGGGVSHVDLMRTNLSKPGAEGLPRISSIAQPIFRHCAAIVSSSSRASICDNAARAHFRFSSLSPSRNARLLVSAACSTFG